ncbi:MAG TPA: hypothetical protein VFS40_02930 [Gemmatimonadales bacterium]|nr:hypothetical protein [Gemmatimonadales bacterium]
MSAGQGSGLPHGAPFTSRLAVGCLAAAVVLLPFNSLPYFQSLFGELATEGAFYALVVALACWVVELGAGGRIARRWHWTAAGLGCFLLWCLLSAVVNLPDILAAETKARRGPSKLVLQVVLLVFVLLAAVLVRHLAGRLRHPLGWLRRFALISFLLAGAYSLFEVGSYLGLAPPGVYATIDHLVHGEGAGYFGRVRSVSGEPSWFGMYCGFVLPWLLSYYFTATRRAGLYLGLTAYMVLLIGLSWSRTAYVITSVQVLLYVGLAFAARRTAIPRRRIWALVGGLALAGLAGAFVLRGAAVSDRSVTQVFSSLLSSENLSNVSRAGAQAAAFRMGLAAPVAGVGLGQYGFWMPSFVPLWARQSEEVQMWMSGAADSPWAPAQSLYARLAAEVGFVGLGLWVACWLGVLVACWRRYRRVGARSEDAGLGLALIVSLVGVLLSGMNADSLRFFSYWIGLGFAWWYLGAEPSPDSP